MPKLEEAIEADDRAYSEWRRGYHRLVLTYKGILLTQETREGPWIVVEYNCPPAKAQTRAVELNLLKVPLIDAPWVDGQGWTHPAKPSSIADYDWRWRQKEVGDVWELQWYDDATSGWIYNLTMASQEEVIDYIKRQKT